MSMKLWEIKSLTKRISKYEKYILKVSAWLKRDRKDLKVLEKELSKKDQDEYVLWIVKRFDRSL